MNEITNLKHRILTFAFPNILLALSLCLPPAYLAVPPQTQPPTEQTALKPAPTTLPASEEGTLIEVAPALFDITEAGGNGNVAFAIWPNGWKSTLNFSLKK